MHSGQRNYTVKFILLIGAFLSAALVVSCKGDDNQSSLLGFKLPEQGQTYGLGEEVKVQLDVPAETKISNVSYLLDGKAIGSKNNSETFAIKTADLALGYRLITAVVDNGKRKDTLTINIVLKSAVKPVEYTYKVLNVFPHDTTSYTQGLEYHNGKFLESTGEYGESTLRWVDLQSGKALQKIAVDKQYFGEGSSLVGDKIIMLTWKENIGFVFDSKSLKQESTFPYQNSREGWGLAFDGQRLMKSDGSNRIWFLNAKDYKEESYIDVYDNNGQVDQLNELEYIDGKIYANIYQTDKIAVIDPKNGAIERYLNFAGLLPEKDKFANTDVLNGIAWDASGKRLFITGKKWDKLFQVELVPAAGQK